MNLAADAKYGALSQLHYNLCAYTEEKCDGKDVFAYITSKTLKADNKKICLTDEDLIADATIMYNDEGKKYIEFTQTSEIECENDDDQKYRFTVDVQCDIKNNRTNPPVF